MLFREAQLTDISQLSRVRLSVQENRLSDPGRLPPQDYTEYLSQRGSSPKPTSSSGNWCFRSKGGDWSSDLPACQGEVQGLS